LENHILFLKKALISKFRNCNSRRDGDHQWFTDGSIQLGMPEYVAALTEVNGEVMQIRRRAGRLQDPELSRRLLALAIEIGRGAQEMDSMKDLEPVVAKLLQTAREIPPSERYEIMRLIGRLRIKLDALVSIRKQLPIHPT
jgi:hypothetical protein